MKTTNSEQGEVHPNANEPTPVMTALKFQSWLNRKPPTSVIRKGHDSKGGKHYLPLSYIEKELQKMFAGLVQWKQPHPPAYMGNGICITIDLYVFHPVYKTWLVYTGAGFKAIMLDKKTKDLKHTSLEFLVPNALAMAQKNAAKKLGRRFGQDIARKVDDVTEFSLQESYEVVNRLEGPTQFALPSMGEGAKWNK